MTEQRIGAVRLAGLARLAPMASITNAPFRLVTRECGSGLVTLRIELLLVALPAELVATTE